MGPGRLTPSEGPRGSEGAARVWETWVQQPLCSDWASQAERAAREVVCNTRVPKSPVAGDLGTGAGESLSLQGSEDLTLQETRGHSRASWGRQTCGALCWEMTLWQGGRWRTG